MERPPSGLLRFRGGGGSGCLRFLKQYVGPAPDLLPHDLVCVLDRMVQPVPEHVPDGRWLLRRPEPGHVELTRDVSVRERVAAPVERTPRQDPEPSISQRQELGPWLVRHRVGHLDRLLLITVVTVATG